MIRPYWSSEDRWAARGLLLSVVLLTLAMVYLTVLLNQWNNAFYSALQDKNMAAFRGQLFRVTWLVTFVAILWGLSGSLHVTVGEYAIRLPGYMVWVAVLYAILGTWVADLLGRPLVRLNVDRQRYEADFRFSLVRFRENTEGVALYRGEADEFRGF